MSLKIWNDGEKAENVQAIIENNFKILGKHLSQNTLSLTADEIKLLDADHLSDGLVVFNKTRECFQQYNGGIWTNLSLDKSSQGYVKTIDSGGWANGEISIPYEEHMVINPNVSVYIRYSGEYLTVCEDYSVDDNNNIVLKTDLPFSGKAVIK